MGNSSPERGNIGVKVLVYSTSKLQVMSRGLYILRRHFGMLYFLLIFTLFDSFPTYNNTTEMILISFIMISKK